MPRTSALSEQIKFLMSKFGISHVELGQAVDSSPRTVERWLHNETYPQHESRARLEQLELLVERLDQTFENSEGGALWLHTPSGYFGGLRPLDALLRARFDLIDAALEALDSGTFV